MKLPSGKTTVTWVLLACFTMTSIVLAGKPRSARALHWIPDCVLPTPTPSPTSAPEPGSALSASSNGGAICIDEDGDGKGDGWDVDGDGKIDVRDFNGNGIIDGLDLIGWLAEQRKCAVDLGSLQDKLEIIAGYLKAAGVVIATIFGGTVIGPFIGAIVGALGWILSLFGGGPDIEELYADKELKCDPRTRVQATEMFRVMSNRIMFFIANCGQNAHGTEGPENDVCPHGGGTTWINDWRAFTQYQQRLGSINFERELYEAALGDDATICPYLAEGITSIFALGSDAAVDAIGSSGRYRNGGDQPFNNRIRCTLPEDFNREGYADGSSFTLADFEKMLEPQNNFLGLILLSKEERRRQISSQESINRDDALANQGFRGVRDEEGRVINPGSVLSKVAAETITKELDYLISVDEVGELVGNAIGLTWNRLNNLLSDELIDKNNGGLP